MDKKLKYTFSIFQSVTREINTGQTPKKKKGMTPKKKGFFGSLKGANAAASLQSPGGPNAVRMTNFVHVTTLPITMQSLNKTHFTLDRVGFCGVFLSVRFQGMLSIMGDYSDILH